jgi:hypothetical protein
VLGSVAAGVALHPTSLRAEPKRLDLTWNAPAACPDRDDVLRAIDALVGTPAPERETPVVVRADVVQQAGTWAVDIGWRSRAGEGERRLQAATCDELARATALVVAFAIAPQAGEDSTTAPAGAAPAPIAPVTPPRAAPPPDPKARELPPPLPALPAPSVADADRPPRGDESVPPADGKVHVGVRAGFAADFRTLPDPAPGLTAGASAHRGPLVLALDVSFFAPQDARISQGGGNFWAAGALLQTCYAIEGGTLVVLPCAAAELQLIAANGERLDTPDQRFAWQARFGAGVEVGYRLTPSFRLIASGTVLIAPARPRFVVADGPLVHEPAFVTARAAAGAQFELF